MPHVHQKLRAQKLSQRALVAVGHPPAVPPVAAFAARLAQQPTFVLTFEQPHVFAIFGVGHHQPGHASAAAEAPAELDLTQFEHQLLESGAWRVVVLTQKKPSILKKYGALHRLIGLAHAGRSDGWQRLGASGFGHRKAAPGDVDARQEPLGLIVLPPVACDEGDMLHAGPQKPEPSMPDG